MTAIIETEKLTKSYGEHRGIIDVDLRGRRGRGLRLPRARTAPARRRRSGPCSTSSGRRAGGRMVFGIESSVGSGRDPPARRLHPGRVHAVRPADRRPDDRVLREPPRRRRPRLPGVADRALRPRPVAQVQGVLEGQQAEGRSRHRPPAPARAADPRRADLRARPARPADVLRARPRGERRGPDGLPLEPHPVRGRADLRPGRDHPRRPAGQGRPRRGPARPRPSPGRAAVRRTASRSRRSRGCPACSEVTRRGPHAADARVRADHAGRPGGGQYELLDFVSREPSLEETFLAQYGQEAVEEPRS